MMLSFWDRKDGARPDFSTIVTSLSNILLISSDYLDLTILKEEKPEQPEVEDSLEHSLRHVPANPNDYYLAGGV